MPIWRTFMFKILITAIFLTGSAFAEFSISNIKLTPTELEIVGNGLEEIKSVAITSNDSIKEFEIENLSSNQVIARPLDDTRIGEGRVFNLVISDSSQEFTYPVTLSQKNGSVAFYKLKEIEYKPAVNPSNKFTLDHKSIINFLPGDDFSGYDYNYSLYANPTGDFVIKGVDKDLFKIDSEGNVEISGTLKVKGRPVGFNIPYQPIKEQGAPSKSANKVAFSTGTESDYTIPMNICPKGQILKSDGVNFVCSLEASQEDQLGPVYTNNKGNFGIDSINRSMAINNVVIGADNNISGVVNFTSSGNMDVASGTFHVDSVGGMVGIGKAAPAAKLDILGANNSGIFLKQGAQATATVGAFKNGLVFEDSGTTKAAAIGYGEGNVFSITGFDGSAYKTLFTLNGLGSSITGPLKIVGATTSYSLPAADGAANYVLKTDGTGTVSWAPVARGTVNGPVTTTSGNVAAWNNATGTLLADSTKVVANLVTNDGTSTNGFVATFADSTGKIIQNGTKLEADLVTGPASASATDNLASFNSLTGKVIKDSGILSTNVMTMTAPAAGVTAGGNVLASVLGTKQGIESSIPIANLATMSAVSTKVDGLILSAGLDKTQRATAYSVPLALCPSGQSWKSDGANMVCSGGAAGDVTGAASSFDNAIPRFDGLSGKIIQNSNVLIDDLNNVSGIATLSTSGLATLNSLTVSNNASAGTLATTGAATLNSLAVTNAATVGGTLGVAGLFTLNYLSGTESFSLPQLRGTAGQVLTTNGAGATSWTANPQGDVTGQSASTVNNITVYADTAGKQIKDSTIPIAEVIRKATNFTSANRLVLSAGINHSVQESIYLFPITAPTANQILKADGSGVLGWVTVPASVGDVTGPAATPTVAGSPATFADATGKLLATVPYSIPNGNGTAGQFLSTNGSGVASWATAGDVTGPVSSIAGNLASFSGTSGKSIQDTGIVAGNVVTNAGASTANAIARFDLATGKIIKTSPVSIADNGDMTGVGTFNSGALTVAGPLTVNGTGSFTGALTAQSYTNTSDRKLKKDITPFIGASEIVDKLVPVTFRWKKGDGKSVMGFIAQDLEKVIPEVVTISKTKDGEVRSYDVGQVLALTLEALKETRAEVKLLQEKIKKLEQKNP